MHHFRSENIVFGGAGPSFLQHFRKLSEVFVVLQSRLHFRVIFADLGLQRGFCSSYLFQNLQILHATKRVEIEVQKRMTFGRRVSIRGGACLAMQILQNMPMDFITPCSPFGVAANILRPRPCRQPLC
jgi:hypothetical protein